MIKLKTVTKPEPKRAALESLLEVELAPPRMITPGAAGEQRERSRSLRILAVKGKREPLPKAITGAFESIIGPTDDRVRILDTDLTPWRMITALRSELAGSWDLAPSSQRGTASIRRSSSKAGLQQSK
jgi:glutamyl endopeptidase